MRYLVVVLLAAALAPVTMAQERAERADLPSPPVPFDQKVRFANLTLEDGLAQGSVYAIHQDRSGFMWFGTQDGVSRYDGYTFKNYAHIPFDSTSAQPSWVMAISEDEAGRLWMAASYMGLSRLDPSKGTFEHYTHDPNDSTSLNQGWVWSTLIDRDGILWVGTGGGGLGRMDPQHPGRFERFRYNPDDETSLSADAVRSIFQDESGHIWLSTGDGLNRMDPARPGRFDRFATYPGDTRGPESRGYVFNRLHEAPGGVMWAGTLNGLVRLDVESGSLKRFNYPAGDGGDTEIIDITPDPRDQDVLWLTMPGGGGVVRFHMPTETFLSYRHKADDPASPIDDHTVSAFTDRSGTVWIGSETQGITRFNPGSASFSLLEGSANSDGLPEPAVWGIFVDSHGNVWSGGTNGTLQVVERETGRIRAWAVDLNNALRPDRPTGVVREIGEGKDGHLWLATSRGLDRFDPVRGRFSHYRHDPDDSTSVAANNARAVLVDSKGIVWAGTTGPPPTAAVSRYDPATDRFSRIQIASEATPTTGFFVIAIAEDQAGMIWFGHERGISGLHPDDPDDIRHFLHDAQDRTSITNGNVSDIHERDREPGVLWLATGGGGLDRLDTQTGEVRHYTELTSELPNNTIYAVLEDDAGHLWLSTNRGLSRFDPEAETFVNYGIEHGLQSLEFNQYAAARSARGEMYFGGVKGINAFYPDEITTTSLPPPVALTDFRLFNERVLVGPDSPLRESIDKTREIVLTHDQARNIGFDFVALHYTNPALNRYAYRLEGFDPDWIDAGTQRSATYTNLPPGDYVFHVKAANSDGVWNETGATVALAVLPPWWRTMWAYVLYGVLFAGSVLVIDRTQRRRLRKKAEFEQAELRASAAESQSQAAESRAMALQADNEKKKNAELLSEIGKELTSSLDLDTIFGRVYEHVNHLVDAPVFGIGLYNEAKQQLNYRLAIENGKRYTPYTRDTKDKNQFPVWCIENRKAVFVNDVETEYSNYIESYKHLGGKLEDGAVATDPQSLIYLPLVTGDRVLGVISIQSFEKNAYSEHDLNILQALATYTAIAVDNADAYRRLNGTIEHLKNAQQQLVQQEKLASLGQLTAGIAHEIKNPLNFVTNFSVLNEELASELQEIVTARRAEMPADILEEMEDLVTSLRVNAGHVAKHGRRADSIVKSMMEHASGAQGERFPVEVNAFVEEYVNLAYHGRRAQSPGQELYVERDFEEGLGSVEMAPQELGRVLVNLLNNAFDAVTEKGAGTNGEFRPTVTIRTRRNGDEASITVEDNGTGIPESVRDHIFEPFFTTKPTGSGTGLGLSLSYDIVTQGHAGRLDVESEPGRGTAFVVVLPLKGRAGGDGR